MQVGRLHEGDGLQVADGGLQAGAAHGGEGVAGLGTRGYHQPARSHLTFTLPRSLNTAPNVDSKHLELFRLNSMYEFSLGSDSLLK